MGALVGHAGITGPNLIRNKGKGSTEEALPNRMVLSELTKGDPTQRSMNNYAKSTPGGANPVPSFMEMAHGGTGVPNQKYSDK